MVNNMNCWHDMHDPLTAPERLVAETRLSFRTQALEYLHQASEHGMRAVEVDLSHTREIDASGLGVLVLLQKRSREQNMPVRLRRTSGEVQAVLVQARLDGLFEID